MEFNFTKSQLEILQKLVEYPDDFKYPLGTIIASDDIHAVDNIGGQWDQIEDRFLLGAGSTFAVNPSGGSVTHKHTLESGFAKIFGGSSGGSGVLISKDKNFNISWADNLRCNMSSIISSGRTNTHGSELGGTTDSENNMPPYMAKYMWIKTKLQSELEGENV